MTTAAARTVTVVTGSRAEYGLLRPVMRAIRDHPNLNLNVVVTGTHLLPPARTLDEVAAEFPINATVQMQESGGGPTARLAEAAALGRGVLGLAEHLADDLPDVVLVLGDRIEAFAATAAASVAGIRVAHLHGGDRAEGIVDEALRHAITKLAHIHLPATPQSAERILCMGEPALSVHLVGSPAIDELEETPPLDDDSYAALGSPAVIFLLHPTGESESEEYERARQLLDDCVRLNIGNVLALHPNHDPGREGIVRAIDDVPAALQRAHLPREKFIGLLKRVSIIVGNSSAGLIECSALGVPSINIGPRQAGRQSPGNVVTVSDWHTTEIRFAMEKALVIGRMKIKHPYGDGHAGQKTADILATFKPDHHPLRKRNTY